MLKAFQCKMLAITDVAAHVLIEGSFAFSVGKEKTEKVYKL
jgi:hypothetical protein